MDYYERLKHLIASMDNVLIVRYDERYAPEIKKIRRSVFVTEQQIDEDIEFDGNDKDAIHVLLSKNDKFVGTGRMLANGHIGRLAVYKAYRGQGLGRKAVMALVEEAREQGLQRVYLGAQLYAVPFYKKLGFSEFGRTFMEAGIEHIHMEKYLSSDRA
jgi:predicted GNAT family N-acyltransferase